ncbi:MAG TPA: hypothetical protein VIV60_27830, partial [Polyangiaceae bacterium]
MGEPEQPPASISDADELTARTTVSPQLFALAKGEMDPAAMDRKDWVEPTSGTNNMLSDINADAPNADAQSADAPNADELSGQKAPSQPAVPVSAESHSPTALFASLDATSEPVSEVTKDTVVQSHSVMGNLGQLGSSSFGIPALGAAPMGIAPLRAPGAESFATPPLSPLPAAASPPIEVPQVEVPQVEAPQVEAPQVEAPQAEVPPIEASQVEVPPIEASPIDADGSGDANVIQEAPASQESVTKILPRPIPTLRVQDEPPPDSGWGSARPPSIATITSIENPGSEPILSSAPIVAIEAEVELGSATTPPADAVTALASAATASTGPNEDLDPAVLRLDVPSSGAPVTLDAAIDAPPETEPSNARELSLGAEAPALPEGAPDATPAPAESTSEQGIEAPRMHSEVIAMERAADVPTADLSQPGAVDGSQSPGMTAWAETTTTNASGALECGNEGKSLGAD